MSGQFALVVDESEARLELGSHETLVLIHRDGGRERVGLRALGAVVLHGKVALDSAVIHKLTAYGVSLVVLAARGRNAVRCSFTALPWRRVRLRHAQHRAYADPQTRLTLAREVVAAKCEAMAAFAAARGDEPTARAARQAAWRAAESGDLDALRGLEGAASRRHFALLESLYAADGTFTFAGRSRRPPRDPPNALMSLGYTLALAEAAHLATPYGLDVQLGFLHGVQRERESLALDLIEPARVAIDAWVLELLSQGALPPEVFYEDRNHQGGVRLTKAGRAVFYPVWFSQGCRRVLPPMRRLLGRLLRRLRTLKPPEPA